jgi:hypothetical protein
MSDYGQEEEEDYLQYGGDGDDRRQGSDMGSDYGIGGSGDGIDMEGFGDREDEDLIAEIGAAERAGPGGGLGGLLIGEGVLNDLQNKIKKTTMSPEDRFLLYTDAICRGFNDDRIANLSESDITAILEKARNLPNIKYKNPEAFILGYIATAGGKTLTTKDGKARVKHILTDMLPRIHKGGVEPPDVIRYARLWMDTA